MLKRHPVSGYWFSLKIASSVLALSAAVETAVSAARISVRPLSLLPVHGRLRLTAVQGVSMHSESNQAGCPDKEDTA